MITPQFTYDNAGKKVGVFLSIEDWEQLERIPGVDKIAHYDTPEWHIPLIEEALNGVNSGTADLKSWEETKKLLKL